MVVEMMVVLYSRPPNGGKNEAIYVHVVPSGCRIDASRVHAASQWSKKRLKSCLRGLPMVKEMTPVRSMRHLSVRRNDASRVHTTS